MSAHEPYLEDLFTHLVNVHGCGDARGIVETIQAEAAFRVQHETVMIPGAERRVVVDISEQIGEHLSTFELLHREHHDRAGIHDAIQSRVTRG